MNRRDFTIASMLSVVSMATSADTPDEERITVMRDGKRLTVKFEEMLAGDTVAFLGYVFSVTRDAHWENGVWSCDVTLIKGLQL